MNAVDAPAKVRSDVQDHALAGPAADPPFADLHLHTLFSDGTFTPEQLAALGSEFGLAAMSLTDHDTVEGCERMARACQALGIEFIVGTELTAEFADKEVHVLGYFLDPRNAKLLAEIKKFQAVRKSRIHEMVARLNKINIPLRAETVFALANCRSPGRAACGAGLGAGRSLPKHGRGLRTVFEEGPPGLGAQMQDFRPRRHRFDSSGRRSGGGGPSGFESLR